MGPVDGHLKRLRAALETESDQVALALDVVRAFDADYDVPWRRNVALGILVILLPEAPLTHTTIDQRVAWLGKVWCGLVDADMRYDLMEGIRLVRQSETEAEVLYDCLHAGGIPSDLLEDACYVLARWNDGAGRINFRCGDMMGAQSFFGKALDLACWEHESATLWYDNARKSAWSLGVEQFGQKLKTSSGRQLAPCFDDIASNMLRAGFDAKVQAGATANLNVEKSCFELLQAEALARCRATSDAWRRCAADAKTWWERDATQAPIEPRLDSETPATRERLRGLCNVEHNLAVAHKGLKSFADSRKHAEQSASIAFALGDQYRFAQSLRHIADLLGERDEQRLPLFGRIVERLSWQRGKWMARQSIGRFELDRPNGEAGRAIKMLRKLYDEMQASRIARGADTGLDVDVLRYTASILADAYDRDGQPDKAELVRLTSARSLRGAVKATSYRRQLKREVLPLYRGVIKRHMARLLAKKVARRVEAIEALLTLAEELTGREMLDLLATQNLSPGSVPVHPEASIVGESDPPEQDTSGTPPPLRDSPRSGADDEAFVDVLRRDREEFERLMQARALAAVEIDEEVIPELRRWSAMPGGPTIFRYVEFEETRAPEGAEKKVAQRLGAIVIHRGRIERLHIFQTNEHAWFLDPGEGPKGQKVWDHFTSGAAPSSEMGRMLWMRFIEPLWILDERIEHLVIIPAPGMFSLPLHVALVPREFWARKQLAKDEKDKAEEERFHGFSALPLGVLLSLSFSVSASSFVRRQAMRHQPFDATDDLCVVAAQGTSGAKLRFGEVVALKWAKKHFHIAGSVPGTAPHRDYEATGEGVHAMLQNRAEIFVYAGHGRFAPVDGEAEVALALNGSQYLTQYGLLTRYRLQRNKWTLLDACVSGAGADQRDLAEVSGFLKTFIAAGAGALSVTLWKVQDDIIGRVAKMLLERALASTKNSEPVDIVQSLRDSHREEFLATTRGGPGRGSGAPPVDFAAHDDLYLGAVPMVLYL